ncbi:MAG: class I SAM-dependent methyltransferase [Planctomycetes bacterium]|nr:class I SAM-dependent methyltransferase [Planctomycetota bacterium]
MRRLPAPALHIIGLSAALFLCGCKKDAPPPTDPVDGNLELLLPRSEHHKDYTPPRMTRLTVDGKDFTEPLETRRRLSVEPGENDSVKVVYSFWATSYTNIIRTRVVKLQKGKRVEADLTREDAAFPDEIKPIYYPTPYSVVQKMCELGKVGKGDVVYDIGCGDGRLVVMAIEKFHAKRGVGRDINADLIKECQANAKKAGVADRAEFRVGDALKIKDLSEASVVLLYLGEHLNEKLRPILQKTLKPGSRVLSHRFKIGDWKPEETVKFTAKGNEGQDEEYVVHRWTIKAAK